MKFFYNKETKRALLIGETEDDKDTLKFFFDANIVFGMFYLWVRNDAGKVGNFAKAVLNRFPNATAVAQIRKVEHFIPEEKDRKKIDDSSTSLFDDMLR